MTRDQYNKKIQAMQEVWPEGATRVRDAGGHAFFEIYFDRWHVVGTQRHPFQEHAEYEWNEDEEIRLMAHFARGVTSDRPTRTNSGRMSP